jgi:hypothetical protein
MNLREPVMQSHWLMSYPLFNDALRYGATCFGALPLPAKVAAMRRTPIDPLDYHEIAHAVDGVAASFVEISALQVEEAVLRYLARPFGDHESASANARAQLDELARQVPAVRHPEIARPPCLLSTCHAVFMEGWLRYFFYRARGDATVPLLAVDWPRFDTQLQARRARYSEPGSACDPIWRRGSSVSTPLSV